MKKIVSVLLLLALALSLVACSSNKEIEATLRIKDDLQYHDANDAKEKDNINTIKTLYGGKRAH